MASGRHLTARRKCIKVLQILFCTYVVRNDTRPKTASMTRPSCKVNTCTLVPMQLGASCSYCCSCSRTTCICYGSVGEFCICLLEINAATAHAVPLLFRQYSGRLSTSLNLRYGRNLTKSRESCLTLRIKA